jgi:tetratricopeptide (TPR) repeat protein
MSFAGDLEKFPLADVFQSCNANSMTGALAIRDERGERLIAFKEGLVVGASPAEDGAETLAGELVRRRMVDENDIAKPSRFFKRKGSLKRSLTRRKVLNSAEFNSFTRSVVLERVYDCFLLDKGKFEFLEDYDTSRFDGDEEAAGVQINVNEILMEAMRRVDEWGRIRRSIPSFREVYVGTRAPTEEDSALDKEILTLTAAGTLDLEGVMKQSPAARFEACEAIMALLETGAVRCATVPEYVELGRKAEKAGDLDGAASFYARGLAYERGNVELNERRIALLEKLDRKTEAADERKLYAATLLEKGDKAGAAEQYRKAAELAPSDPLPLERLLDRFLTDKDFERAKETAGDLVALYLRLGLGEGAKKVYPRLLQLEPKDRVLRERMADVHAELHEAPVAGQIFKELGQEALEDDDADTALRFYRKAAEQLPEDKKLADTVKGLETGELAARLRRRRVFRAQAALLVGFCLVTSWVVYEGLNLHYLRRLQRDGIHLDGGPEEILNGINALRPAEPAGVLQPLPMAHRWAGESALQLARLYVREAEAAGRDLVLPPPAPDGEALPREEAFKRLTHALEPPQDESLRSRLVRVEKLLSDGQVAEADAQLTDLLSRLREARLALLQSSRSTRGYNTFKERLALVRELSPRLYLALGQARIQDPEARVIVQMAALRVAEARARHSDEQ